MKIGLIDVDSHNFPNLALMKISAHHKNKGDFVEFVKPFVHYDKVYLSKVFSFTSDYFYAVDADEIEKGGTGYAIKLENGREIFDRTKNKNLPDEIEHTYPDYSLYGITDTAYGFLTRGCPRGCQFCIVGKKEGLQSRKVADLSEFWRGQKNIVLCDPNILACRDHLDLLQQLVESRARIDFNQGLDVRLITAENLVLIKKLKTKRIHFAYDRFEDKDIIEPRLRLISQAGFNRNNVSVYILCNFDSTIDRDLHRIQFCRELNLQPYVMIYDKQHSDKIYRRLQRWCSPFIFWSTERFEDYEKYKKGGINELLISNYTSKRNAVKEMIDGNGLFNF